MPVLDFRVWHGIPGFPGGSDSKESACNAGDAGEKGSIPGLGTSPEERNSYHSSILKSPMNKGVWQATVHRVANSWT